MFYNVNIFIIPFINNNISIISRLNSNNKSMKISWRRYLTQNARKSVYLTKWTGQTIFILFYCYDIWYEINTITTKWQALVRCWKSRAVVRFSTVRLFCEAMSTTTDRESRVGYASEKHQNNYKVGTCYREVATRCGFWIRWVIFLALRLLTLSDALYEKFYTV